MNIEVRTAKNAKELDEAYEVASKIFGPSYFESQDAKTAIRSLESTENLKDAIVAVADQGVVGFIRILNREIAIGKSVLKVGGITSVCLHPKFRGKGYSKKLMETALSRLHERKDALSITFARRAVDGFYPRFGYVGVGCHPEMAITLKEQSPFKKIPQLQMGADLGFVRSYMSAYEASYSGIFMSFCRDAHWWDNLSKRLSMRIQPEGFVTVKNGKQIVGYFICVEDRVIEAACAADCQEIFTVGLITFFQEKKKNITLSLPLDHWAMKSMRCMNHTLKVRCSWDGGHMANVFDRKAFQAAVKTYVDTREHMPNSCPMDNTKGDDIHRQTHQFTNFLESPFPVTLPTWSHIDEF